MVARLAASLTLVGLVWSASSPPAGGDETRTVRVKAKKGQMLILSGANGKTIRKLKGGQKGDEFGVGFGFDSLPATNIDGEAAIGAPGADNGAGRLFAVDPETGRRIWFISGNNLSGGPVEGFGHSMTNLGHVNQDNDSHWAIGAPGGDGSSGVPPAVVVVQPTDDSLIERLRLEGEVGSRLGWQTILSDQDGGDSFIDHFVAGAPTQANGGKGNAGAIHRFAITDGTRAWTLLGKKRNQHLGYSLSFGADEDGDGVRDLTVGAPGNGKTDGMVLLVSNATGRVLLEIKAPNGAGLFGFSVSRGDIDSDGTLDYIVGAPATDGEAGSETGKVYIFSGADRSLLWSREGDAAGQWFGASVTSTQDLSGDGLRDLLVGSLFREHPKPKKVLRGGIELISPASNEVLFSVLGKRGGDRIGVPLHGPLQDYDGDGIVDLLVPAPRKSEFFVPE